MPRRRQSAAARGRLEAARSGRAARKSRPPVEDSSMRGTASPGHETPHGTGTRRLHEVPRDEAAQAVRDDVDLRGAGLATHPRNVLAEARRQALVVETWRVAERRKSTNAVTGEMAPEGDEVRRIGGPAIAGAETARAATAGGSRSQFLCGGEYAVGPGCSTMMVPLPPVVKPAVCVTWRRSEPSGRMTNTW